MEGLEVTDSSTASLVAYLAERLVNGQEFVEHVTEIGLLLANSHIDCVVTASGVESVWVERVADGVIPVLEPEFALVGGQCTDFVVGCLSFLTM